MQQLHKIFNNKRIKALLCLFAVVLITTLAIYTTKAYEVRVDNKYIGLVKTKAEVQDILEDITEKSKAKYGTEIFVSSQISYKRVFLANKNKIAGEVLWNQVESNVKLMSQAFAINVDGKEIAFLKNRLSAEKVLNKIKVPYIQNEEDNVDVGFLENVIIVEKKIPINQLKEPEEVFNNIILQSDQIKKYTVKEGDTVSGIVTKFGLNVEDIQKANPGINVDSISIGQKLSLIVPRYAINVKKSTLKTYEEKIPFEVEYENSQEMYSGDTKVKVKGTEGRKLVKAELVSINGILEDTNIIDEDVIKTPNAEIVLKGIKERPRTIAYGVFKNPSRGSLTSRFGERWNRAHTGVDIGVPKGTPNKAADGGVVKFAGWDGTYGKLVIIDHENGYTTYYAHNDTIKVKKGQRVARGDIIGTAGTTGRVTGPHLHFEIRKNGTPVNPLKYIQ